MSTVLTPPSAPFTDTSSMLAGVGTDFLAGAADIPVPVSEGSDDTPAEPVDAAPGSDDTPVGDTPADETPVDATPQDTPAADTTPAPDATPAAAAPEELDEGTIKVKDRDGKYKYRLDESRYKTVYGNHQLVQQATDLLGEPLTLDAIKLNREGFLAQERLFDHITSGEPERQAGVINFLIQEMKTAQADGETGVDPTVPFAETMYSALREQAPDAYAHLRLQAARDLVGEMFETASATKNPQLFSAAQHFAATLAGIGPKGAEMTGDQYAAHIREVAARSNIPFHTMAEMEGLTRGEEPLTQAQRRIQELESQLNGRSTTGATEQFSSWNASNVRDVNAAIYEDAVKPALASAEDSWKDFKDDYRRLVEDPLNSEVVKAINGDAVLREQANDLRARARRATSEAKRQEIGEQIKQLYVNRARLATEKAKVPILRSGAEFLKARSTQTGARRTAAQSHSAPSGTATPVRQSVLPEPVSFKNGMYDARAAFQQATALVNAGR